MLAHAERHAPVAVQICRTVRPNARPDRCCEIMSSSAGVTMSDELRSALMRWTEHYDDADMSSRLFNEAEPLLAAERAGPMGGAGAGDAGGVSRHHRRLDWTP